MVSKLRIESGKKKLELLVSRGLYPKRGLFSVDTGNKFDSTEYIWYRDQLIVGTISVIDGRCNWFRNCVKECIEFDKKKKSRIG